MPDKLTVQQFAQRVRSQHPGAYDDIPDAELTKRVLDKYPQYQDMVSVSDAPAEKPSFFQNPRAFLQQRITDLQQEAQNQQNQYLGPEGQAATENAKGFLGKGASYVKRFGHGVASLVPETAAFVDKGLLSASEWKNAIPIAAGAISPAIPAAYFGAQGTMELPNQVRNVAQNPTPENAQNALATAAMVVGAANGAAPAPPGTPVRPLPKGPQKVADFLKGKAADFYQSGLKPSLAKGAPDPTKIVNTGLKNEIPISAAGVEKLGTLIDNLNNQIASEIRSKPAATISRNKVVGRLQDTYDKFSNQVNPLADQQAIADSGVEFLRTQPTDIPAVNAQALKVGTYSQLRGKYGQLSGAAIESQKALVRGIKEELVNAFPDLKHLNAREADLLQLGPALERAVDRTANHNVIGIGGPIFTGAVKAATGSTGLAAVAGTMKAIIDTPSIKSKLAIALYKAGNGRLSLPAAQAKVQAYVDSLYAAGSASNEAPDDQSTQ